MDQKGFDKKLRERLDGHRQAFNPDSWQRMEELLDQRKRKRRPLFWLLFPGMLLLGIAGWYAATTITSSQGDAMHSAVTSADLGSTNDQNASVDQKPQLPQHNAGDVEQELSETTSVIESQNESEEDNNVREGSIENIDDQSNRQISSLVESDRRSNPSISAQNNAEIQGSNVSASLTESGNNLDDETAPAMSTTRTSLFIKEQKSQGTDDRLSNSTSNQQIKEEGSITDARNIEHQTIAGAETHNKTNLETSGNAISVNSTDAKIQEASEVLAMGIMRLIDENDDLENIDLNIEKSRQTLQRWSFDAGASYGIWTSKINNQKVDVISGNAGITYQFNRHWGIESGMTYSMHRSDFPEINIEPSKAYDLGGGETELSFRAKKYHTLSLPLAINYSPLERLTVSAFTGIQYSLAFEGILRSTRRLEVYDLFNSVGTTVETSSERSLFLDDDNLAKFDMFLGAGIDYNIWKGLVIQSRVQYHPNGIIPFDSSSESNSTFSENKSWISAGLKYILP